MVEYRDLGIEVTHYLAKTNIFTIIFNKNLLPTHVSRREAEK